MIFALIGNQNCGKTTLFNQLTGANQHVGNFPGVTVDQKVGEIKEHKNCSVVDLPGIYSLRPYTSEEIVTRDFLINEKPEYDDRCFQTGRGLRKYCAKTSHGIHFLPTAYQSLPCKEIFRKSA